MEGRESILEAIYEEGDEFQVADDVEMVDAEEGELVDRNLCIDSGQSAAGDDNVGNQFSQSKNWKRNKKRNRKRRGGGTGPNVADIDKFVIDTCRRLKEKKSYMVYTAIGILGVSAVHNLVKQVDAVLSCGGQMTADGRHPRTGGGILWNIMKTKEPMAYKEIMKKSKEFEKQFRRPSIQRAPEQKKKGSSQEAPEEQKKEGSSQEAPLTHGAPLDAPDGSVLVCKNQNEDSTYQQKHKSVHDRIRIPVSYDDILGDDPTTDAT